MSDRNEHFIAMVRLTGPLTLLALAVAGYLRYEGRIGTPGAVGVILLGPLAGAILGLLLSHGTTRASEKLVRAITAAHDIAPAPSFSFQESLVARGKFADAREAYQAHLAREPGDLNAHLALAALWRDHLRDPLKAEALYLETRRLDRSHRQEFAIANALIDLYHATGQRGREMAELARFADSFGGTEAGARAREALQKLKASES